MCLCLFSALGDAVLVRILQYLPVPEQASACLISTRWNHIVLTSRVLWSRPVLDADTPAAVVASLQVLASPHFGRHVAELAFPKLWLDGSTAQLVAARGTPRTLAGADADARADASSNPALPTTTGAVVGAGVGSVDTVEPAPPASVITVADEFIPTLPLAVSVSLQRAIVPPQFLSSMLSRSPLLLHLNLAGSAGVDASVLRAVSLHCPGLQSLSLRG